jgi:hypothetical protein
MKCSGALGIYFIYESRLSAVAAALVAAALVAAALVAAAAALDVAAALLAASLLCCLATLGDAGCHLLYS